MPALRFTADSAADAIAQVHRQLGPDAVILHVQPAPMGGFGGLWRKRQIEVTAQAPESPAPASDRVASVLETIRHLNRQMPPERPSGQSFTLPAVSAREAPDFAPNWLSAAPITDFPQSHVFVGPAGSGKTTVLCKWLAQVVLVGGRSAHVWRLDSRTANSAEALSIYGEILGVPVERSCLDPIIPSTDFSFIDLPGCDWTDAGAVAELGQRLATFGKTHVHLVLNAAYHAPILVEQLQASSVLPIDDVILTHLEEVRSRSHLLAVVRQCPVPIRFLSEGQNVPGKLIMAELKHFLPAADQAGRASAVRR